MTVSRWKVMAGVLGVSLGGLAALAGQAPKVGETRNAEPPMIPELPMDKAKPAAPLAVPPLPIPGTPNALPILTEPPVADAKKAAPNPVVPASGIAVPTAPVIIPTAGQLPPLPAEAKTEPTPPKSSPIIPSTVLPESKPSDPPPNLGPAVPSSAVPQPPATTTIERPAATTPATVTPAAATTTAAAKYRILLRVGEGEPQFEVRNGDDLMMKVLCEKVDVTSPAQKGGPATQQVTASGKVRFAGFGSEGTCDQLSFVAGTGELILAGNVTIQVKDKLGRIDSELKSDKVKYKLDASTMPGVMKP